jgi:hypothetical protein
MDEERTPTAGELDARRREVVARTLDAWIEEHERLTARGAGAPPAGRLDALTAEAVGLLVRLQVCRGLGADAVARGLAESLAEGAAHYAECAAVPEAAERDLDAARAATFRALVALLGGGAPPPAPPAARRD